MSKKVSEIKKMQTNINNLKTLYTYRYRRDSNQSKSMWIIIGQLFSIEQLGYLLENCSKVENRPILSDEKLAQLLYVCETYGKCCRTKTITIYKKRS